jgi:porin
VCTVALLLANVGVRAAFAASAEPDPDAPASRHGFKWALVYDGNLFSDMSGGLRRGTTYNGIFNVAIEHVWRPMRALPDITVFADALSIHGGQPGRFSGDAQDVSNIAGPTSLTIYEAWLQANFSGVSALAGLYDINSEFYRLQSAGLFLNSSFGIGPEFAQSGKAGPSIFPRTAAALRLDYKPSANSVVRAVVANGVPFRRGDEYRLFGPGDGALIVAEAALLARQPVATRPVNRRFRIGRQSGLGEYGDKIAFGVWHYTASFADLSETDANGTPLQRQGNSGAYAIADATLVDDPKMNRPKVSAFVQLGVSDPRVNRFGSYVGVGLRAQGLAPGQDQDELGLAVAHARNSSHFMHAQAQEAVPSARAETTIELTYLLPIGKRFAVQPDVQYVIRPNTDRTVRNALVAQFHFEITF